MLTEPEIYQLLERKVAEAGSQKAFAERHGISPQYLCDILSGRRMMGPKVLAALGYEEAPRMYQHSWAADADAALAADSGAAGGGGE